ncbi:hypothetical protein FRC11_008888 [Ceratobasidium sp. 423]|nr:hypothetical protein FRC11_008888 [Ceratobasidium sp. 423]
MISPTGLELNINNIIQKLGLNKLDLFEPARYVSALRVHEIYMGRTGVWAYPSIDPNVPIEETMAIGKIAAVEIEVSFWSYEEETRKVITKAAEVGEVVAAYSPLGQGALTGKLNPTELHKNDHRNHFPRFQEEAFKNNMKLVDALKEIAEKKDITLAQLCLAWVSFLGSHMVPISSSTRAARTWENMAAASIELIEQDLEEIKCIMELNPVSGDRYSEESMKAIWG